MWPFTTGTNHEETIANLQEELRKARAANEQVIARERETMVAQLQDMRAQLESSKAQFEASLAEKDAALARGEQKLLSLMDVTNADKKTIASLTSEVETLANHVEESKKDVAFANHAQRKQKEKHQKHLEKIREECAQKIREATSLHVQEMNSLRTQYKDAMEKQAAEHAAHSNKMLEEKETLEATIGRLTSELDVASQANVELVTRVQSMQVAFNHGVVGSKRKRLPPAPQELN